MYITPENRAFRTLKKISNFASHMMGSMPNYASEFPDDVVGRVFGVYENLPGTPNNYILLADFGLVYILDGVQFRVDYTSIFGISYLPSPRTGLPPRQISLNCDNRVNVVLSVHGRSGKMLDIHSFMRYLLRVCEDATGRMPHCFLEP